MFQRGECPALSRNVSEMESVNLAQESILPSKVMLKPASSLDSKCSQISTWRNVSPEERQRKRVYSSCLNGLLRCQLLKRQSYFLTLTSSPRSGDLSRDWDLLVKRVRRELNYPFHFVKVETSEGYGVIHALFHSAFDGWDYDSIHAYFSCLWNELHKAPIVWCTIIRNTRKAAGYMVQYVERQNKLVRMSASVNWLFPHWRKRFSNLIKRWGFRDALRLWNHILSTSCGMQRNSGLAFVSKRRALVSLEQFRNGYKTLMERQSFVSLDYSDNTSGQLLVDSDGIAFFVST